MSQPPPVDVAADNDVIVKAACYGLSDSLWPDLASTHDVGVLGSARYVLPKVIDRMELERSRKEVAAAVADLLGAATVLEPTEAELQLAAEMELLAQRHGLDLDVGESQLAAVTVQRSIAALQSGDKRAARAFEKLLDLLEPLAPLAGREHCLEQLLLRLVNEGELGPLLAAICSEPNVDTAASTCFGCYSQGNASRETVVEGLESYIEHARKSAPRVLAP